jgi:hypothetical protein
MAEFNESKPSPPSRRIRSGGSPGNKKPKRSWFKPGNTVGFKKGQSGNPGGRPKQIREVEELAQTHSFEAIERLMEIVRGEGCSDMRVQLLAIEAMLNRAMGKPTVAPPDPVELPRSPRTSTESSCTRTGR